MVILVAGCAPPTDEPARVGTSSRAVISDQLHNGGTVGFVFLPPMVPPPGDYGEFVPDLPVTVRVDELNLNGSVKRSLATFTSNSGPRRERIRVKLEDGRRYNGDNDGDEETRGYYLARWDTDDENLSLSARYRVRVMVPARGGGTRELGFADLKVVRGQREFLGVDTNEFTPLINGRTLRIKFRIARPAVDADGDGVFDWNDNCPRTANRDQRDTLRNGTGDACRCDGITCAPADACHAAGTCSGRTGRCTNPELPDGTACAQPNGVASCRSGVCTLTGCVAGFKDCNGDARDGCETDLRTVANCGACGTVCPGGLHATAACTNGSCALACDPGFADCSPGGGCETPVSADADNCGACGNACPNNQLCQGGGCTAGACRAGFANCDGNAGNGCESASATDANNCGACGVRCAFANAAASCSGGTCVLGACAGTYADCDGQPANGCESDLSADAANCGACSTRCQFPHAGASCAQGSCVMGACEAGFADCAPGGGCETSLIAVGSCGACGNDCATRVLHATPSCDSGADGYACGYSGRCEAGWADCDGDKGNGCETALGTLTDCSACGAACAAGANASASCVAGACVVTCAANYADCNRNAGDGCEKDLTTPADCGACGRACKFDETCQGGACTKIVCNPGFAVCPGNNGCQTNIDADARHCGRCGVVCSAPNANPECRGGVCGFSTCLDGYADCDGDPNNGCEVHLTVDASHCGACGTVCDTCNAGACGCSPGKGYVEGFGCVICGPGSASKDGTLCAPCQGDTIAALFASTTCQPCPNGTHANALHTACLAVSCAAGQGVDGNSCVLCTPGSYGPGGFEACRPCDAGRYTSVPGQSACADCSAGSFSPSPGASSCSNCETGTFNDRQGAASCIGCSPGTYQDQLGSTSCRNCGAGTYNTQSGSSSVVDCVACAAGLYSSVEGASSDATCLSCDVGQYSPAAGAAQCLSCGLGTYSSVVGASSCTPCEAGRYNDVAGRSLCAPCGVGKYSAQVGATSQATCQACVPGTYADVAGLASCAPCPVGYVAPGPGADSCWACSPGSYNDVPGSLACRPCQAGRFSRGGVATCDLCAPGSFSGPGAAACTLCSRGRFASAPGQTACEDCQPGTFSVAIGSSSCSLCPVGTYQAISGGQACQDCEEGTYNSVPGSTTCSPCPAGSFSNLPRASACEVCPAGTYSRGGARACESCPVGYYPDGPPDAVVCRECPRGARCP